MSPKSPASKSSPLSKPGTGVPGKVGSKGTWHNLQRDAKGRWVRASGLTTSIPIGATGIGLSSVQDTQVMKILDTIKDEFQSSCPRCSGDMQFHRIRCGPERLVRVKKCNICNFWLPISDT